MVTTIMDQPLPTNPKVIAERGEAIYNDKYRKKYEDKHQGKFVIIDVVSEKAYLGDTVDQAFTAAREGAPAGVFHLIKVGAPGAFRVSYSSGAALDWVFQ